MSSLRHAPPAVHQAFSAWVRAVAGGEEAWIDVQGPGAEQEFLALVQTWASPELATGDAKDHFLTASAVADWCLDHGFPFLADLWRARALWSAAAVQPPRDQRLEKSL